MFLVTHESLHLAEAGLHGLCASLNTPVVNIEGVPVGPARAAIVVCSDDQGGLRLAVGLRSLENGQVVLFAYQGELDPAAGAAEAMDGALSFAEGMGFLFDEDMVAAGGAAGRVRSLRHWQELVGEIDHGDQQAPATGAAEDTQAELPDLLDVVDDGCLDLGDDDLDSGDGELLLDEVALSEIAALDPPEAPDFDQEVPELAAEPASPSLSKFRRPEDEGGSEAAEKGKERSAAAPAALGRIAIAKLRLGGKGPDRPSVLTRLLGSF